MTPSIRQPNVVLFSPRLRRWLPCRFRMAGGDGQAVVGPRDTLAGALRGQADRHDTSHVDRQPRRWPQHQAYCYGRQQLHVLDQGRDHQRLECAGDARPTGSLTRHGDPHVLNQSFEGFTAGSANNSVQQVLLQRPQGRRWTRGRGRRWVVSASPTTLGGDAGTAAGLGLHRRTDARGRSRAGLSRLAHWQHTDRHRPGETKGLESRLFAGDKEVGPSTPTRQTGHPEVRLIHRWGWFCFVTTADVLAHRLFYNRSATSGSRSCW